jgi:hypothetical protein
MYKQYKHIFSLGNRAEVKDEVTCQSIKRSGNTKNGIYTLRNAQDKYPRLALCKMESTDGYEDETMETAIGYMDPRSLPGGVLFSAMLKFEPYLNLIATCHLTYNETNTNVGNSLDISTGIFQTQVDGIYQFTFSSVTGTFVPSLAYLMVQKNGIDHLLIMEKNENGYYNKFGQTWVMNLLTGDKVGLYLQGGTLYIDNARPAIFTGELILE